VTLEVLFSITVVHVAPAGRPCAAAIAAAATKSNAIGASAIHRRGPCCMRGL
jgi:hypothetical protein